MLVEPLFDFESGEFVFARNGDIYLVAGEEALKNWIRKTLHTAAGRYRIYNGTPYGTRIEELLVGKVLPRDYLLAETERYVREAICRNPEVTGIDEFALTKDGALVSISLRVKSVYGETDVTEVISVG